MSEFNPTSVAYPLKKDEFTNLDKKTKKKLIKLMARISEASYRRGFQQGHCFSEAGIEVKDLVKLRFGTSLNQSPFTDSSGGFNAIERLFVEYGVLRVIGFRDVENEIASLR